MSVPSASISAHLLSGYRRDGIIQIGVSPEALKLQTQFLDDCCLCLRRWGGIETSPGSLPRTLAGLAKNNRALVGQLYKVARRFPSVKRLASLPDREEEARTQ